MNTSVTASSQAPVKATRVVIFILALVVMAKGRTTGAGIKWTL